MTRRGKPVQTLVCPLCATAHAVDMLARETCDYLGAYPSVDFCDKCEPRLRDAFAREPADVLRDVVKARKP